LQRSASTPPEVQSLPKGDEKKVDAHLRATVLPLSTIAMTDEDYADWLDAAKWVAQGDITELLKNKRTIYINNVDMSEVAEKLFTENSNKIKVGGNHPLLTPKEYVDDMTEHFITGINLYNIQQEAFKNIDILTNQYKKELSEDKETETAADSIAKEYNKWLKHWLGLAFIKFHIDYIKALKPHFKPLVRKKVLG